MGARLQSAERALIVVLTTLVLGIVGFVLFYWLPRSMTELLGIALVVALVIAGVKVGSAFAESIRPTYNVAEVTVEGPITRDGGGSLTTPPVGARADDIVDQIERADEDDAVEALLVTLNTPGGEIVPSEDIRIAAQRFDGPTVGYATDVCASGGYDIAAGCDELWARSGSIVGSIGVIGSRVNASELAERVGLSYEQFTAGEYKDAGLPLKEIDEEERAYLQHVVDEYYEQFVATVADGRSIDEDVIRDTEAKIYLGTEAEERGLVDQLGTRREVEDRLESELDKAVTVEPFEPERGLASKLAMGSRAVAYAFGRGVARVADDDVEGFSIRT